MLAVLRKMGKQAFSLEGGFSCPASKTGNHTFNINILCDLKSEIM
jgi:hypothetical protein